MTKSRFNLRKVARTFIFILAAVLVFSSCKKPDDNGGNGENNGNLPTLSTLMAKMVTTNSFTLGGNISFVGNPAYSEKGICYSTSENPTINNKKISISGEGTGDFTTNITGLTSKTIYYVRAYATNSKGTAYGNQIKFATVTPSTYASSVYVSGSDVYVAGFEQTNVEFGSNGGKIIFPAIAKLWKNGVPQNLTDGSEWAEASSVFVVDNDVFVAGVCGSCVALWKNGEIQKISDETTVWSNYDGLHSPKVYVSGNNVYVVGNANGSAKLWKNGVEQSLANGNGYHASSIYISGNDVYVTGSQGANGNRAAKLWKNGIAQNLTDGTKLADAYSVFVSDNDVYVAGNEQNAAGSRDAILWKNGVPSILKTYDVANSVFVSKGIVYVAVGDNQAKIWIDGKIETLGGEHTNALSVHVAGNDVYVAGQSWSIPSYTIITTALLWKNGVKQVLPY